MLIYPKKVANFKFSTLTIVAKICKAFNLFKPLSHMVVQYYPLLSQNINIVFNFLSLRATILKIYMIVVKGSQLGVFSHRL